MAEITATACPVAALAAEARAVTATLDRNEEEQTRVGRGSLANVRLEHERWLLEDRRTAIETGACRLRAHSPEGVLFQLALAVEFASMLHEHGDPRWATESEAFLRHLDGALHSAATFLERGGGPRREEVFGPWYLSRRLDPHAAVEAALAAG